jgi:hypothetical protein
VIAFSGGFHGRTLMTMALTGKVMPYKRGFGPFPAEVYHANSRSPTEASPPNRRLADIDRLFHGDVDPKSVAAIIIEPVQGEGGFNVAPFDFLRALRRLCDEHGIVMIADEVQGGVGRTGKMFSIEHSGVVPDLITLAKGLGGGFPLSAVTGRATIMDAAHPGGLGGTYGGNPISIAAAHAVLDVIESEDLCARARRGRSENARGSRRWRRSCPASAMCAASAPWSLSNWSRIRRPRNPMPRYHGRHPGACRKARLDPVVLRHLRQCGAAAGAADHSGIGSRGRLIEGGAARITPAPRLLLHPLGARRPPFRGRISECAM